MRTGTTYRLAILLLLAATLSACGQRTTTAEPRVTATHAPPPTATAVPTETPAPPDTPRFERADCPFEIPAAEAEQVALDCGYLVVPEKRADPTSRDIRLAVAIYRHPEGATAADPIVYLVGGPGGSMLRVASVQGFEARFGWLFAAGRDIIFFDQRGIGYSQPALDCPGYVALNYELLDLEVDGTAISPQERRDRKAAALIACAADLRQGADLSAYHTAESAADVEDLRRALGYEQINLWGGSYGARLALDVLRDHPQGLRSAILESGYPPEADLIIETPGDFYRALTLLAEDCAADAACGAAYPDLLEVFWDTVARLNETPDRTEVFHPLTHERYEMLLTGDSLAYWVFESLYFAALRPSMPQVIYDASTGEYQVLLLVARDVLWRQELRSWGMTFSVLCHEEVPFSSPEDYQAMLRELPAYTGFAAEFEAGESVYEICAAWGAGEADPVENLAVGSDIPALVLAGAYDPISPPHWSTASADGLANGTAFVFPGLAHGVSSDACAQEMMIAFLDDPQAPPDGTCVDEIEVAAFEVPTEVEIALEPFAFSAAGLTGVIPSGWTEARPGTYIRGQSALDNTALVVDVAPIPIAEIPARLAGQYGLDKPLESTMEREANGMLWTLYALEVQGHALDFAVTPHGEATLLVVLQCASGERDPLYEGVLLPVIDALQPAN